MPKGNERGKEYNWVNSWVYAKLEDRGCEESLVSFNLCRLYDTYNLYAKENITSLHFEKR